MNIQVLWNGVDITEETIGYERTGKICSGVSNCTVTVAYTGRNFNPYNTIVIYEGGIKKGTYFVTSIDRDINNHTVILETQDVTKQLNDYFITETYNIEEPTYAKYWIEKFLTEAGVGYQFDVSGSGSVMNNQDVLGMQTALEVLTKLVQISGWYFYADSSNIIHIGKLEKNTTNYKFYLRPTEILNFSFHKDDKMLRNRSVVWGASNPATQQWAFADVRVKTGYETSANDLRSTLVVNTHIENKASAVAIANKFLKEMKKATEIKTVVCAGYYNFILGDTVFVQTKKFNGSGLVTSYVVSATTSGVITTFILDERCPRMFGYYAYDGYVYISTNGAGVWRKPLRYTHVWEDFSTGLSDLNIVDLAINNGIFACVSDTGNLYIRSSIDSAWTLFTPPAFIRQYDSLVASGVICTSCSIDKVNNHVYATYTSLSGIELTTPYPTISGIMQGSWLIDMSSIYPLSYTSTPIVISGADAEAEGMYEMAALDIDNTGVSQVITVVNGGNNPFGKGSVSTIAEIERDSLNSVATASDIASGKYTKFSANIPGIGAMYIQSCADLPAEYGLFELCSITNTSNKYYANYRTYRFTPDLESQIKSVYIADNPYAAASGYSPRNQCFAIDRDGDVFSYYVFFSNYSHSPLNFYDHIRFTKYTFNIVTDEVTETTLYDSVTAGKETKFSRFIKSGDYIYHFGRESYGEGYKYVIKTINVNTLETTSTALADYPLAVYPDFSDSDYYKNYHFFKPTSTGAYFYFAADESATNSIKVYKLKLVGSSHTISEVGTIMSTSGPNSVHLQDAFTKRLYYDKNTNTDYSVVFYQCSYTVYPSTTTFYDGYFDINTGTAHSYPRTSVNGHMVNPLGDIPISRIELEDGIEVRYTYIYAEMSGKGISPVAACNYYKTVVGGSPLESKFRLFDPTTMEFIGDGYGSPGSVSTPYYICENIDDIDHCIYANVPNATPNVIRGFDHQTGLVKKTFNDSEVLLNYLIGNCFINGGGTYNYELPTSPGKVTAYFSDNPPSRGQFHSYGVIQHKDNQFIDNNLILPAPSEVESSLTFPAAVFGTTTRSGILSEYNQGFIYISPYGAPRTYSEIMQGITGQMSITDAREVDIEDGEDGALRTYVVFPRITPSGTDVTFFDATDIPTHSEIYATSGIYSSGIANRYTFSGEADHLEFTNYAAFEFISLKGTPTTFYQRERDATNLAEREFINRNTNIPSAEITQIRCDDSL